MARALASNEGRSGDERAGHVGDASGRDLHAERIDPDEDVRAESAREAAGVTARAAQPARAARAARAEGAERPAGRAERAGRAKAVERESVIRVK